MKLKRFILALISPIALLASCIGTDVIEEIMMPPVLEISSAISSIKVGESATFTADYFNTIGEPEEVAINWSSSNASIISINSDGLATAYAEGEVFIYAMVENLKDSVLVEAGDETVSSDVREATFQGKNSYNVAGEAVLEIVDGVLQLRFKDNFSASSGPGLHVYLSNSSDGVSGGIDLGELKENSGAQTYDIPNNVGINTYDFVIIYCQPFSVTFGFGELN